MEKLSKEQIVSSVNEKLSSFLEETSFLSKNYHDVFKDYKDIEAYLLIKDFFEKS